ncbi:FAD-binding monooxygenase [Sedimentitalea sp. JM2-8]|uniref:FAD-binding monooxygenase n=1 Tax=Sedimentitalea xiamensis TaxID=3050037 RepID=A0ABT7FFB8_9RHOB|nr:FAD-binding monooxygenase [Sedimentitalea xiamensis]MDK3073821.1 FAD-binding monooxygenase [Sedimentitalea xiamensis]
MQFHLNGFRPGDPDISEAVPGAGAHRDGLPAKTDVLIVGSGPAGLTLAAQLSAFPEISTCIVERKPGPMEKGQADGVSCRSMEMFQAFGFAEAVKREAYWVNEAAFWKPGPGGGIVRNGRVQDVRDGLSEMPHVILNQARVHDMYLDVMRNAPSRLTPDYGFEMTDLSVEEDAGDHPVTVTFRPAEGAGPEVKIRARYVVGCDGARSSVRKAIGRTLTGEAANHAWGVMDVLCTTDFPDIRFKSLVRSADQGTILIIPREGGYLVRLYIEMDKLAADERVADRKIRVDDLIAAAQRILRPYSFEVKDVAWWSVYEIGQRLCDKFDDVPVGAEGERSPRVFIAGDACHTHSPKAGQGMNVSMGDTFNLGWKLAAVLHGQAEATLLHSYSAERQGVARNLIDFDREWAKIMSDRSGSEPDEATPVFQKYFIEHGRYTAGVAVRYAPSALTGDGSHQALAHGFEIGARFHSAPVIRFFDAKPMHLGHVVQADGRWRVFVFVGTKARSDADALLAFLADDPAAPLRRFTRAGADPDSVIDLRAIYPCHHHDLDAASLPDLLLPRKGRFGLTDHEKVFCADQRAGQDIYALRGIDRTRGCIVVVRPDQYVANILPIGGGLALATFFDGILRPAT